MCGAARPTKPINPVNAIIIEVAKAEITRIFLRNLDGSTPVDIAKSSPPIAKVLRSQEYLISLG